MNTILKPTISTQCLGHLRQLAGVQTSSKAFLPHFQTRGKKKLRQPHVVKVRLLEDIRGYGRKGSIIPIAPGRMRNIYYPQRKAEYVTAAQLRTINQKDILTERDFNFGNNESANRDNIKPEKAYQTAVDVRMKLLNVKRAADLLERLVPKELVFYRVPIGNPKLEAEQPREPVGSSINAIGGGGEQIPQEQDAPATTTPEATRIFGSVSVADMVDSIKAVLAEDEEGARVVLGPEDISIMEEEEFDGDLDGDEYRIKALGEYKIEIRLKGVEPVRRVVSIRAQEEES